MVAINSRKIKDCITRFLIYMCASFSVVLLVGIITYVLIKGLPYVSLSFLISVTSVLKGTVGIAGNIVNTILIILLTMIITLPIGVGSAIYLNEYAKLGKIVTIIEYATETLAGIPSIIFGLFGMMFFGEGLSFGYSLITGALTLIIMVLPLITRNTQEALKTVPDSYRTGAIGLGSGKWHMIRTILIPSAMPGIITGMVLAIGRIVGESAALLFTAGSAKLLPVGIEGLLNKPFQSGGTLSIQMYLSATSEGDFDTAFAIAVVLLIIVLAINLLTKVITKHFDVTRKE